MSHSSIDRAANDVQLQGRVKAAVYEILYTDDECRSSIFGQAVLYSGSIGSSPQLMAMYWAVAVATETQYTSAVQAGRGAPGYDADVIADQTITNVVMEIWPKTQPPAGAPTMMP